MPSLEVGTPGIYMPYIYIYIYDYDFIYIYIYDIYESVLCTVRYIIIYLYTRYAIYIYTVTQYTYTCTRLMAASLERNLCFVEASVFWNLRIKCHLKFLNRGTK